MDSKTFYRKHPACPWFASLQGPAPGPSRPEVLLPLQDSKWPLPQDRAGTSPAMTLQYPLACTVPLLLLGVAPVRPIVGSFGRTLGHIISLRPSVPLHMSRHREPRQVLPACCGHIPTLSPPRSPHCPPVMPAGTRVAPRLAAAPSPSNCCGGWRSSILLQPRAREAQATQERVGGSCCLGLAVMPNISSPSPFAQGPTNTGSSCGCGGAGRVVAPGRWEEEEEEDLQSSGTARAELGAAPCGH